MHERKVQNNSRILDPTPSRPARASTVWPCLSSSPRALARRIINDRCLNLRLPRGPSLLHAHELLPRGSPGSSVYFRCLSQLAETETHKRAMKISHSRVAVPRNANILGRERGGINCKIAYAPQLTRAFASFCANKLRRSRIVGLKITAGDSCSYFVRSDEKMFFFFYYLVFLVLPAVRWNVLQECYYTVGSFIYQLN